jgi:hypothetical protein
MGSPLEQFSVFSFQFSAVTTQASRFLNRETRKIGKKLIHQSCFAYFAVESDSWPEQSLSVFGFQRAVSIKTIQLKTEN